MIKKSHLSILLLILATIVWGLGFVGARWTLSEYSPLWTNTLRFAVAGIISLPFLLFYKKELRNPGIIYCSFFLIVALQLQTMGLALTSLAKSGFITVFYAIFTPVILMMIEGKRFRKGYWALLATAMLGIGMLCDFQMSNFNRGDFLTLVSALFFSFHIVTVDRYCAGRNPVIFNMAQCFVIGVSSVSIAYYMEGIPSFKPLLIWNNLMTQSALSGLIILAVLSSILAFSMQIKAQQGISPHIVSLIFLLESVFAALFGFIFFDERLSVMAIAGCLLVLAAVSGIPSVTGFEKKRNSENQSDSNEMSILKERNEKKSSQGNKIAEGLAGA